MFETELNSQVSEKLKQASVRYGSDVSKTVANRFTVEHKPQTSEMGIDRF